jgi:hypothetical protein
MKRVAKFLQISEICCIASVLNEFKMGHCSKKCISSSISNLHSLQIRLFNGIFYNAVWKIEIFNDRPGKQHGNKLRTYRLFKNNFAFESYLDLDNSNRNILIKFRISAHNLEIEKGFSSK